MLIIRPETTKFRFNPTLESFQSFPMGNRSSGKAKRVADLFIKFLSTEKSPPAWNSNDSPLISKQELLKNLTPEKTKGLEGKADKMILEMESGKRKGSPSKIALKIMDKDAAEEQVKTAQNVLEATREINDCWLQI